MKKLLAGSLLFCMCGSLFAGGTVLQNKNEITGKVNYTYTNFGIKTYSDWALKVECNPEGHMYFSISSTTYGWGIDSKHHARFDFKLDNLPVEKYKVGYSSDSNKVKQARDRKLILRLLSHNKIIVDAYSGVAGLPTPIFDIKDFRSKSKVFAEQCSLKSESAKSAPKPATPAPKTTTGGNTHQHGGRSHSHPLPAQGVAHKHGNSAIGTK